MEEKAQKRTTLALVGDDVCLTLIPLTDDQIKQIKDVIGHNHDFNNISLYSSRDEIEIAMVHTAFRTAALGTAITKLSILMRKDYPEETEYRHMWEVGEIIKDNADKGNLIMNALWGYEQEQKDRA